MRVMFTIIGGISVADLVFLAGVLREGATIRSAGTIMDDDEEKHLMEVLVPTKEDSK